MSATDRDQYGVWFPAIRSGTGTDVFTERLAEGLESAGIRTAIDWMPLRAEYAPWTVRRPKPPDWATIAHVNSCLHSRFVPSHMKLVVTTHHCVHDPQASLWKSTAQRLYHRFHLKPIERRMFDRAEILTAVSSFTAEANRRVFGPIPITVIPNGIDIQAFAPPRQAVTTAGRSAFSTWAAMPAARELTFSRPSCGNLRELPPSPSLAQRNLAQTSPKTSA